jgi:hypothetical protein
MSNLFSFSPLGSPSGFSPDVMEASFYGYRRVWSERAYLARLALIPILMKFACMVVIISFEYQDNFLRQGLIMLPASFAEGWLLAQFLRTLLMGERWPTILPQEGDDFAMARLILRAQGIVAATLVYVLILLFEYVLRHGLFLMEGIAASQAELANVQTGAKEASPAEGNPIMVIPAILMLLGSIWAFRLMWLHIPFSVLMAPREYLRNIAGFVTSIRMMAVFLASMVPLFLVAIMTSQGIANLVGGSGLEDIGRFAIVLLSVATETVVALIATAAMAFAMRSFLPRSPQAFADAEGKVK